MADGREERIHEGLVSLIHAVLPPVRGEDDASIRDRRTNAYELARNLLER
jgi:hypothetical protein